MDFFTFFVLVFLAILLIYARKIENRRRRGAETFVETASNLTARVHSLERQLTALSEITSALTARVHDLAGGHTQREPAPAPQTTKTPEPKPIQPSIPAQAAISPQPAPPAAAPAAQAPPKAPLTPRPPLVQPPIPERAAAASASQQSAAVAASAGKPAPVASASHSIAAPLPPMIRPPQTAAPPAAQQSVPFGGELFKSATVQEKRKRISLEEAVGTNWAAKVGITLLVIGVAFLTRAVWGNIAPWLRVVILYSGSLGLLGCGIFLEKKERYRTLGRALIGGGWATTFLVTFTISHAKAVLVLPSITVDLFLLLAVAAAMVWHTLKYNSQTVTGCAFLLGFISVAFSRDPQYAASDLIAGAILIAGMTVIVLRRQWFELEVFGILASYLNHLHWLYPIISAMPEKGPFPDYKGSVALMVSYWAIFRASYLLRKISNPEQERVSTIAGLLNPLLFLAVMKYQSYHPEWAFYALLIMGAIEFTLGQLPVCRRRSIPFKALSSLGATLMVVAIPMKYSGKHTMELLWMAGAEAFLLAGVFARERLFRVFGGIISLLVALYVFGWPAYGIVFQAARIVSGQPHYDPQFSLILAVIAALFYVNSHVIGRVWEALFDREYEQQALTSLSFIASLFAVGAVYMFVQSNAVAVVLALLVTVLALLGKKFEIYELLAQSIWIAAVAVADVSIIGTHLDASWHSIPERLLTFPAVAALLYFSSRFVRFDREWDNQLFTVLYRWAGTGLITLMIWLQTWFAIPRRDWLIAVLWTALALTLSGVAHLINRNEFKWQACVLAIMSFLCALVVNFDFVGDFHHLSYRLISVTLVAGGIYLLAGSAPLVTLKPVYSWMGTILFGYLAYRETQAEHQMWTPVLWIGLAAVLGSAARFWKDRALLWQTPLLAAAATAWTLAISFRYHQDRAQLNTMLLTVLITSGVLCGLTWVINVAKLLESDRIRQPYSWAGSLLLSWLMWYQLQPINRSLAWCVFGLILFELGYKSASAYLRAQGYVALASSFVYIFLSNFNSHPVGSPDRGIFVRFFQVLADPSVFTVVLLVPVYFWVYKRLHEKTDCNAAESKLRVEYLLACIGTAAIAALARFEMPAETVVVGYSLIVLAALIVAWQTRLRIFLYQTLAMLAVTAFRLGFHNFRSLRSSFVSALPSSIWAIAILTLGLPIAFQLRSKDGEESKTGQWIQFLVRHPEQPLFFVTVTLLAVLLAIKVPREMITLAWGIQGIAVFLLALLAKERSFRLTGLGLLAICVAKIVFWDVWQFVDKTERYLTLIGVGAILLIVSYLYGKNREALREYL